MTRKESGEKYGSSQQHSQPSIIIDSLTVLLFAILSDVFINILLVKNGPRLDVYLAKTVWRKTLGFSPAPKRWKTYTTQTCDSFLFTTVAGSPTQAQNIHRLEDEGMGGWGWECVKGVGAAVTHLYPWVSPQLTLPTDLSCTASPCPPSPCSPLPLTSSFRFFHHRRRGGTTRDSPLLQQVFPN